MSNAISVRVSSSIYGRIKEFSKDHERSVIEVTEEALTYWLDTVASAVEEHEAETIDGEISKRGLYGLIDTVWACVPAPGTH